MGNPVATNIIVGGAVVYNAPVGETVPDETSITYGTAWGGNWERVGFTKAPLAMKYEDEHAPINVEEMLTAVKRVRTAEDLMLETVLAELIADYLALVTGGTVTTTASGVGQVGFEQLDVGGTHLLPELTWGFEGFYANAAGAQFPVRLFVHKANAKINGEITFSKKNGDYPGIPLQISALADSAKAAQLFTFQRVTAAAGS